MRYVHTMQCVLLLVVLLLYCERGFAFSYFEYKTPYSGSVMAEQWTLDSAFVIFDDDSDMTVTGRRVRFLGFTEMPYSIAEWIVGGCMAAGGGYGFSLGGGGGAAFGAILGGSLCYLAGVTAEEIAAEWVDSGSDKEPEPPWAECDGVLVGFAGAPLCIPHMPE